MDWTGQRQRFRAHLAGTRCVHPASVFDPLSARIAEMLGYEIGMYAGSLGALTVLAAPEKTPNRQNIAIITLTEFVQQAYRICRAFKLPLLVDADAGYGNAFNVMRTVQELETAGVAAVMIEDTLLPTKYGYSGIEDEFVSIPEMLGKLKAALHARQDPLLTVIGRSKAIATEECVARARAYEEAGVDAVWFSRIRSRPQLEAICKAIKIPILSGLVPDDMRDMEYLASQRVRTCGIGHQPIRAAIQAVYNTLKDLRAGVPPAAIKNVASDELFEEVTRDTDYTQWAREFLGADYPASR